MDDQASIYESLRAWILQMLRVREAPHRIGGIEFQVDGVGFMHSHGPSWLDIRLSKEDQASVLKTGQALPHQAQVHAQAGWFASESRSRKILRTQRRSYILPTRTQGRIRGISSLDEPRRSRGDYCSEISSQGQLIQKPGVSRPWRVRL